MSKQGPTGSIAGPLEPAPSLGDTVTFETSSSGLKGWQYPMVVVAAYQDVDGDGNVTIPTVYEGSPELVYAALDHPDAQFVLGGGWSQWRERGGSALCIARLYAYGFRSGRENIVLLDETDPWAATG